MSLAKLREERNKLRNCLRLAKKSGLSSDVIRSLAGQFHQLLRQYNKTSRLEQRLSGEKAVRRERKQCVERFSAFAKKILEGVSSPSISGPAFDEQMAQEFFTDIYRSNNAVFQHPNWLPHPATPSHPFEEGPITSEKLDRVLRKVRQRASPSPLDQVSYSVLRRCPSLQPAPTLTNFSSTFISLYLCQSTLQPQIKVSTIFNFFVETFLHEEISKPNVVL